MSFFFCATVHTAPRWYSELTASMRFERSSRISSTFFVSGFIFILFTISFFVCGYWVGNKDYLYT